MDAISLSLFASRIKAVCDEMGALLQRAAFSPNIRDRLDYSCAVFDAQGELCAQAAHIPVHLGSMAYAMRDIVSAMQWQAGDMLVLNDPYMGGTHLPDVTVIAPVFINESLLGFVANRAHHADIGADSPGSMPISTCLSEEGLLLPPTWLYRAGVRQEAVVEKILAATSHPLTMQGDFAAQVSANLLAVQRLTRLIEAMGAAAYEEGLVALNDYAERLAETALRRIPYGHYSFKDVMDDDGSGQCNIPIQVVLKVQAGKVAVDFRGSAAQVAAISTVPYRLLRLPFTMLFAA